MQIKIVTIYGPGSEGIGWYTWEADVEDEGWIHFSDLKPTLEELQDIHPGYTYDEVE